jgi:hypothetical protein
MWKTWEETPAYYYYLSSRLVGVGARRKKAAGFSLPGLENKAPGGIAAFFLYVPATRGGRLEVGVSS